MPRRDMLTTKVTDFICATGEPVDEQGQNIAKTALVYSSWDDVTVGAQLNRYCAGGLDAVNTVAMKIMSGMESMGLAGGVTGVITKPYEGAAKDGVGGFFKGRWHLK